MGLRFKSIYSGYVVVCWVESPDDIDTLYISA